MLSQSLSLNNWVAKAPNPRVQEESQHSDFDYAIVKGDPHWMYVKVYRDGRELLYCIEADAIQGWAIVYVGSITPLPPSMGNPNSLRTTRVEGRIQILFSNDEDRERYIRDYGPRTGQ